jgi:hypothetical protein
MNDSTSTVQEGTFKPANVQEQLIYSRALNAVIWGMPAVNFQLMHEGLVKAKGDFNQVVYWSGLISAKNQTLTGQHCLNIRQIKVRVVKKPGGCSRTQI